MSGRRFLVWTFGFMGKHAVRLGAILMACTRAGTEAQLVIFYMVAVPFSPTVRTEDPRVLDALKGNARCSFYAAPSAEQTANE